MILRKRDEIIEGHAVEAFCEICSILELNVGYLTAISIKYQPKLHQICMSMKLVSLVLCGGVRKVDPVEI